MRKFNNFILEDDISKNPSDKPDDLKKKKKIKENTEEYKPVNYKAYLDIMNKMKMDELFLMVFKRIVVFNNRLFLQSCYL